MKRIAPISSDTAIALAYGAIALAVTWPLGANPGGSMIGAAGWIGQLPDGDVNYFLWAFWWFRQALSEGHLDVLRTPLLAHPGGMSLVSTTITPLWALASVPLQTCLSLVAIYNVFLLFSLWASAFFTYRLARALGTVAERRGESDGRNPRDERDGGEEQECGEVSRAMAFVAGCAFGFTNYHIAHATHLNLLSTQWIPFTVWAVWRALATRRAGWAALGGMGVALEAYSDWYLSVFLGLLLSGVALARGAGALARMGERDERRLRPWLWAAVAAGILLANLQLGLSLLIPFFFIAYGVLILTRLAGIHPCRQAHLRNLAIFAVVSAGLVAPFFLRLWKETGEERTVEQVSLVAKLLLSAEPWTYVLPPRAIRHIAAWLGPPPMQGFETPSGGEYDLFPGCAIWALCAWTWFRLGRRARQNGWLVIGAAFAVLSWGAGLKSFGRLVPWLTVYDTFALPGAALSLTPFLTGLRVFARFGIVTQLCLALWLAANLDGAWAKPWRRRRRNDGGPAAQPSLAGRWLTAAAMAALILSERFPQPLSIGPIRQPNGFAQLRALGNPVVLGLPLDGAAAMMYCQSFHGLRLVNFSGSRVPAKTHAQFEKTLLHTLFSFVSATSASAPPPAMLTAEAARRVNAEAANLGVDALVIHRALCARESETALRRLAVDFLGWSLVAQNEEFLAFTRDEPARAIP